MAMSANSSASEELTINKLGLSSQELTDSLKNKGAFEIFEELKSVVGSLIINKEGYIVCSNLDDISSGMFCSVSKQILQATLCGLGKHRKPCGEPNNLNLIRINSCSQELLICPMDEEELILIIVQNPTDNFKAL